MERAIKESQESHSSYVRQRSSASAAAYPDLDANTEQAFSGTTGPGKDQKIGGAGDIGNSIPGLPVDDPVIHDEPEPLLYGEPVIFP